MGIFFTKNYTMKLKYYYFLIVLIATNLNAQISKKIEIKNYDFVTSLDDKYQEKYITKNTKGELITVHQKKTNTTEYFNHTNYDYLIHHYNKEYKLIAEKKIKAKDTFIFDMRNDSLVFINTEKTSINQPLQKKNFDTKKNEQSIKSRKTSLKYIATTYSLRDFGKKETTLITLDKKDSIWKNKDNTYSEDLNKMKQEGYLHISHTSKSLKSKEINELQKLIYLENKPTPKESKKNYLLSLGVKLYNSKFNLKLQKNVVLAHKLGLPTVNQSIIDTLNNEIYILTSTLDIKKSKAISTKRNYNNYYHLLKISKDTIITKLIDLKEGNFADVFIKKHGKDIVCFGVYSKTSNYNTDGFIKLDYSKKDLTLLLNKEINFSKQFLVDWTKIHSKYADNTSVDYTKIISSYGRPLNKLDFKSVYLDTNNDWNLIFSEHKIRTTRGGAIPTGLGSGFSFTVNPSTKSIRTNISLIVAKIANNGNLIWSRNIEDKAEGAKFKYHESKNSNLYIAANIPEIHLNLEVNDKANRKQKYAYMLEINNNGELSSNRFFESPKKSELSISKNFDYQTKKYFELIKSKEKKTTQYSEINFKSN